MTVLKDKPAKAAADIAKALILPGLPFVHTLMMLIGYGYADDELMNLAVLGIGTVLGGPVFLTCLGIDLSENRSGKNILKMGVQMLLIALLMNFLRYVVPNSLWVFSGKGPAVWLVEGLFANEIYPFVGLFCICYGLARKCGISQKLFGLLSLGLFALNLYISRHAPAVGPGVGSILANFYSGQQEVVSYFPLLGWAIFPCMGMVLGRTMKLEKRVRNRRFALLLALAVAGLAAFSAFLSGCGTNLAEVLALFAYYYEFGLLQAIPMLCIALLVLTLFYFLYELIPENRLEKSLIRFSNMVLPFYFSHYVILFWVALIPLYVLELNGTIYKAGPTLFWAIAVFVEATTLLLCRKKGYSLSRWLFSITNYERWGRKKTPAVSE